MNVLYISKSFAAVCLLALFAGFNYQCTNNPKSNSSGDTAKLVTQTPPVKPPYASDDTLLVNVKAAVFFYPDSLQLDQYRQSSSKAEYETVTHESFYQMRNAKIVLNEYWPKVKVIEAKAVRYLLFTAGNSVVSVIDLNNNPALYGLYLFTPGKQPQLADMMNIDTALGFYFK